LIDSGIAILGKGKGKHRFVTRLVVNTPLRCFHSSVVIVHKTGLFCRSHQRLVLSVSYWPFCSLKSHPEVLRKVEHIWKQQHGRKTLNILWSS